MKFFQYALLAVTLALSACQKQEPVATGDTSQSSVDWAGSYSGTLPCADCEGIKTVLTIVAPDKYSLSEEYLGKSSTPFTENGIFKWDAAGSVISIQGSPDSRKFKVGEGRIWHLDLEGNIITGSLADNYILTKSQ